MSASIRERIAAADAELAKRWEDGAAASELAAARARVVDEAVLELWRGTAESHPDMAIAAVGGYGRGELFPRSDVDLLVLTPRDDAAAEEAALQSFFAALWDQGLAVGHAVRSPAQCRDAAAADITVATALMEARLLAGPADLFARMMHATAPPAVWPAREYFAAKLAEQAARHARYNDTAYNLEPNPKEGPGGLRDLQLISWLAQRLSCGGSLEAMTKAGLLGGAEAAALNNARETLWRIRWGLHLIAKRPEERLLFEHQRELARRFGLVDEHRQNLAVEQFMQKYFRAAQTVERLGERVLLRLGEMLAGAAPPRALDQDFVAIGDYLDLGDRGAIVRSPAILMRAFWLLLEHPELKGLRAELLAAIDENLSELAPRLRVEPDAHAMFLAILRHPGDVDLALKRMSRYRVLGAYLPAFGQVAGRMQYDLFHVYTVDQHTLTVLDFICGFAKPARAERFPLAHELRARLRKPELLILAGLFHDIAKGRGGDHSELGEAEAREFGARVNLSGADTDLVAWLVREHLIMSVTAQKQDIADPAVVHRFAERVADLERLDYLYLLTVADINGTSPKLWNSWKDRLLADLHQAARFALRRGLEHPVHAAERAGETKLHARAELQAHGFADADVDALWSRLPPDSFLRFAPDQLAWISAVILRGKRRTEPVLVAIRRKSPRGGSKVLVYARDRDGLFATITAVLDRFQLSVVEARIMNTSDGWALDTFQVLTPDGEAIASEARAAEVVARLTHELSRDELALAPVKRVPTRAERQFALPAKVEFERDPATGRTQLSLVCGDRPGLLAQVALALRSCGVRVHGARIATFGERAEDFFEVSGEDDRALSADAEQALREALQARLDVNGTSEPSQRKAQDVDA